MRLFCHDALEGDDICFIVILWDYVCFAEERRIMLCFVVMMWNVCFSVLLSFYGMMFVLLKGCGIILFCCEGVG